MSGTSFELKTAILRAGAGAGKTTRLVSQVVGAIDHFRQVENRWPRLVVTTFTRKATQELRDRLVVRAVERRDMEMLHFCSSASRLHISTIHGVLSLFLRRYGHLWGLDPNFVILAQEEAARVRSRILRQSVFDDKELVTLLDFFSFSNLAQILRAFDEALTKHKDLRPLDEVHLNSLWGEAVGEIARSVREISLEISRESQDKKYFQFARELLAWSAALEGLSIKSPSPLDSWPELPKKLPFRKQNPQISEDLNERLDATLKRVRALLQRSYLDPNGFSLTEELLQKLDQLGRGYSERLEKEKRNSGRIEMSDLELLSLKAMREHPILAEQFASEWDYWLIDEYQDTSPLQVDLLNRLVGSRPNFIVGDPQQSIYLFRGARSEVFHEKLTEVKKNGGVELAPLTKNYRSKPELLALINDLVTPLGKEFMAMQSRDENFDLEKACGYFYRGENEIAVIARHILYLQKECAAKLSDICVLGRTNHFLFEVAQGLKDFGIPTHIHSGSGFTNRREIRDALALFKFLVHPHDDLNFLTLLRSPWCRTDDSELCQMLDQGKGSHWEKIVAESQGRGSDLWALEYLKSLRELSFKIGVVAAFRKGLIDLGFLDFSGHEDSTGRKEANLWKLIFRLQAAEIKPGFRALDFCEQLQEGGDEESVGRDGDAITAIEPDCVNLMTIHAAKGLERPHVIVPFIGRAPQETNRMMFSLDEESGLWATNAPIGEEGRLERTLLSQKVIEALAERERAESLRVFYVALTRAQESIFLSCEPNPSERSWAAKVSAFELEPGPHLRENYRIQVLSDEGNEAQDLRSGAPEQRVREPYPWPAESRDKPALVSVSQFLEDSLNKSAGHSLESSPVGKGEISRIHEKVKRTSEGVLLHRMMEMLRYRSLPDVKDFAHVWFGDMATDILRAAEYVVKLKVPPMQVLLSTGEVEWGFQLKTSTGILEGQIDLWGVHDNKIWVIDYKSGSSSYKEKAFLQLELYAWALSHKYPEKDIELAVLYPLLASFETRPFGGEKGMRLNF